MEALPWKCFLADRGVHMLSVDQRDGLMRANKPWGPDPRLAWYPHFDYESTATQLLEATSQEHNLE